MLWDVLGGSIWRTLASADELAASSAPTSDGSGMSNAPYAITKPSLVKIGT
jgi:hypothetical protein